MMSSVLPFAPLPEPTGSVEATNAENTEAFVAALAVALGLVQVGRPTPLPGSALGLGELQVNAAVVPTLDGEPAPAVGAGALVPGPLDDAVTGPGGQPLNQPAGQRPIVADTAAPLTAGALPLGGDGALEAPITLPEPASDVNKTTAIRSAAESANTGRFTLPRDLVDAATKQAAEIGTARTTLVRPVGGTEKKQPGLSNGGAQTQSGSGGGSLPRARRAARDDADAPRLGRRGR